MSIEYKEREVPAEGSRVGMVINEPVAFDPAIKYPIIFFLHGIGERGPGTDAGLDKLRVNGSMAGLEAAAKYRGFILVEPQADVNWEHGELEEAIVWAKKEYDGKVNWNKCYLTGLSLGGGGCQRYLSIHPDADQTFAAAAMMCPGPNQFFVTEANYKNIANTKMPLWYFHCADDATVKPDQSTNLTVSKIKAINPDVKVRVTLFNTGGHTGGWKTYSRYKEGVKAATPDEATGFNDPACNIYDWFLMNEISKEAVEPPSLAETTKPDIELPSSSLVPEVPPMEPTPNPSSVKLLGLGSRGPVELIWSDGSKEIKKAPKGETLWAYLSIQTGIVALDYSKSPTETIGPVKK